MTLKGTDNRRARIIQLSAILLNYGLLLIAVICFSLCVGEFGDVTHRVSLLFKFNESNWGVTEEDRSNTKFIEVCIFWTIAVSTTVILVSLLIAVAVVVEKKPLLIVAAVFCSLVCGGSTGGAVITFLVQQRSLKVMTVAFQRGMQSYTTMGYVNYTVKDVINLAEQYRFVVDFVQQTGKCCGYKGYEDYLDIFPDVSVDEGIDENSTLQYSKHFACVETLRDGEGYLTEQNLPYSCCENINTVECATQWKTNKDNNKCEKDEGSRKDGIRKTGCRSSMHKVMPNLIPISALFILEFFMLMVEIVLISYLTHKYIASAGSTVSSKSMVSTLRRGSNESQFDVASESKSEMKSTMSQEEKPKKKGKKKKKG